jgi:hypothetical protein
MAETHPPSVGKPEALERFFTDNQMLTAGQAEFFQDNGSRVINLLTSGPDGIHDLYLTFGFKWQHPEIEEGSPEIQKKKDEYRAVTFKAIGSTLDTIRKMKTEGKL